MVGIKVSLCWHCLTRTLASGGVGKAARKSVTGLAQLLPKPRSVNGEPAVSDRRERGGGLLELGCATVSADSETAALSF